uniref:PDGFA associated protein 1 n=1 Tax=Balaenoptera musculus TaxID=9771 RepID=A0A8C0DBY1_BALMU
RGSPAGRRHGRVGPGSHLVPAFWGPGFSRATVGGWWRLDHSLGGLFCIFDTSRRPFLKQEEEEQGEEGGDGAAGDPKKEKKSLDSDESEDEEDDYQQKRKGVEGLIDIENPNRVAQTTKKVTQLDLDGPKELSRREREEIEKQKAKERYMKMHLAGKTEQAKADLARLAIIRKQREEAARKKEEERKDGGGCSCPPPPKMLGGSSSSGVRSKDDAALSGKRMQSLSLNK